jgi:hypothetical protein
VDGYYANGEERIKTGQCSHCYGQGKIDCEMCGGVGKQQIHSDKYQLIKRFEDKRAVLRFDCLSSTFKRGGGVFLDFFDEDTFDVDIRDCNSFQILIKFDFWNMFNNEELEECINKLYKCQNEIIVDKEDQLPLAIQKIAGIDSLYKKSKEEVYYHWKESGLLNGQLGCALEYHEIIPVIKINCTNKTNNDKAEIFILEWYDYKEVAPGIRCIIDGIPDLSFWQSLFA